MIRRRLVGSDTPERQPRMSARNKVLLSRQEKRALRSLRLVEKVESIGLENIIQTHHSVGISPLAMGVRSRTASPMTQLTSLKNIQQQHAQQRLDDPYAMDRDTIRAVLSKGMSNDRLSDISTDGSTTSSITDTNNDSDDSLSSAMRPSMMKPATAGSTATAAATAAAAAATAATTSTAATSKSPQMAGRSGDDQTRRTSSTHSDIRLKQMQRQKSRRGLLNNAGGQRPDLGTVGGGRRDSGPKATSSRHGSVSQAPPTILDDDDLSSLASCDSIAPSQPQTMTQMFVGSISSLFFGRKGGLL